MTALVKKIIHMLKILNVSKNNAMGDYHDLYLITDILLLSDVFQNLLAHF